MSQKNLKNRENFKERPANVDGGDCLGESFENDNSKELRKYNEMIKKLNGENVDTKDQNIKIEQGQVVEQKMYLERGDKSADIWKSFSKFRLKEGYMSGYIATRWYRAPEIVFEDNLYSKQIDIWGVGCILAELVNREPLFPGTSTENQIKIICDLVGGLKDGEIEQIFTCRTIERVRKLNLKKRISFKQIFDPKNLLLISFLKGCLTLNPAKRMTVDQALQHPYLYLFREQEKELNMQEPIVLYDTSKDDVPIIEARINEIANINLETQSNSFNSRRAKVSEGLNKLIQQNLIQVPDINAKQNNQTSNNFFNF